MRTLWRMLVTRKRLLEWNPSSEAERAAAERGGSDLAASFRAMWIAPAIAAATAIYLAAIEPGGAGGGGADPAPVVRLARHRLVDQPPAGPPRGER